MAVLLDPESLDAQGQGRVRMTQQLFQPARGAGVEDPLHLSAQDHLHRRIRGSLVDSRIVPLVALHWRRHAVHCQ